MRILLIGGTRFIGREVARQALEAGHELVFFNRGEQQAEPPGPLVRGDVEHLVDHTDALRAAAPDAVVHCIAYSPQHAQDLDAALGPLDLRSVVLSSLDCMAAFSAARDGLDATDWPVTDADPTTTDRYYWRGSEHGHAEDYDKNLVTDAVLAAHERGRGRPTVLRLPMVYGPGDPQFQHRHGEALHHVLDRRERYVIGAIEQATLWTFAYVENVAAAILHALGCDAAVGQVYGIAEPRVRTKRRWADQYAAAADHAFRWCPVPDAWLHGGDPEEPATHLIFDGSRFRAETGFAEPVGQLEAVRRTLAWAADHRDALGDPPDYAARDAHWARFRSSTVDESGA